VCLFGAGKRPERTARGAGRRPLREGSSGKLSVGDCEQTTWGASRDSRGGALGGWATENLGRQGSSTSMATMAGVTLRRSRERGSCPFIGGQCL
jgi:hypothetical protein